MPSHSIEFLVAQAFYRIPSHSIECLILHIARNIYNVLSTMHTVYLGCRDFPKGPPRQTIFERVLRQAQSMHMERGIWPDPLSLRQVNPIQTLTDPDTGATCRSLGTAKSPAGAN